MYNVGDVVEGKTITEVTSSGKVFGVPAGILPAEVIADLRIYAKMSNKERATSHIFRPGCHIGWVRKSPITVGNKCKPTYVFEKV
jgi:hypothetical protein